MNISDIKANVTRHSFARPNLFRVKISKIGASDQAIFRINCFQAQIPGNNIATSDRDNGYRFQAYHKLFGDIILGFYCSDNLKELHFFQDWIDTIINKNTNQKGYPSDYTSTIEIEQLSRASSGTVKDSNIKSNSENEVTAKWTLHRAFPKQIDPIQLDYGTNDTIMTINATITYHHFTHDFNPFSMKQHPLNKEQIYAKDELGQQSGRKWMLGPFHPSNR
jgi:hypothetical protein